MPHAHVLGAVHALILIGLGWRSAGRLTTNILHRLCSVYLLSWGNLVYTALILSLFSRLNQAALYFFVSLVLAAVVEAFLYFRKVTPIPARYETAGSGDLRFDGAIRRVLGGVLTLAAAATALICVHYVPNNWDTCTYRLSRAFFYLAQGNLLHSGNPGDPRLSFYPFNGALIYLFLAVYQFSARWFNLVPALSWVFAGIGTYSAARCVGASRTGSLVAAWVCLMSPAVLAQAASGNDEVLEAAPILIGITFGLEWLPTARKRYALLAGLGIGLGLGTKLHWAFYWVFLCAVAVLFAMRLMRRADLRPQLVSRAAIVIAAGALALPLIASFLFSNYISTRQLTATAFNNQVLNTPFRVSLAVEKLQTSTAEMLLSPIPDLVPPAHPEKRQPVYAAFNQFFMKCCLAHLVETTKRSPEGYKFLGPADQFAYIPAETTVWLGFLPHFLLLVCLVEIFTRRLPLASMAFITAFLFWHLTYAVETRYIWWACTYYSFPAVLAAAALGPTWDFARRPGGVAGRLLLGAFFGLFATQALLGANLLVFGGLRNIGFLWRGRGPEMHPVDPPVVSAIQAARRVYLPNTHWEILYWNFMRFNFAARYTTGVSLQPPTLDTLMLVPVPGDIGTGLVPARLPAGAPPALTYLGEADGDHIFAEGDRIETRLAGRGRYALTQITWQRDRSGAIDGMQAARCCVGLKPSDGVALRYELLSKATGKRVTLPWLSPGQPDPNSHAEATGSYDTLMIAARDVMRPDHVSQTIYDLDQTSYVVGTHETSYTEGMAPEFSVRVPGLAREPYDRNGKRYSVAWLRQETQFSVINLGEPSAAILELDLAILGKPHTAVLLAGRHEAGGGVTVRPRFWDTGTKTVRFAVTLAPGENRFVLRSQEPPELLPDGRPVCFLLIGDVKATAPGARSFRSFPAP